MKRNYTIDELFHKAASYCSISEHCIADLQIKLDAWDVCETDKSEIIEKLCDSDFINERRYAFAFVKDKFHFNKWGKIKISYALKQKKIDVEIINAALLSIDEGEYEEMLSLLLQSKLKTIKWQFEYEKMGKLFSYAQSKGFENHIIERVIRNLK